ncbi:nitroreductase family protein [Ottowia thiooxydans]|uniref:nitroreductase family protein n=1 Tax=Ottowia thiooxydans TaxID=219182 RepID=UPI0004067CBA|nr:nitroreductase [Ottowia thiooxydans]
MDDRALMANQADLTQVPHAGLAYPRSPEVFELAGALIHTRQTVLPKRLGEPGPQASQLQTILQAAAAAPDHHRITPWRFVVVPAAARSRLGEAFAAALHERDPLASAEQLAQASEKAQRAPVLMLAIARLRDEDDEIPPAERLVSAGCAIQNMLLMAHALGFGTALTSGKAMNSRPLRTLFSLGEHEQALCFISIGTTIKTKPIPLRPEVGSYASELAL